MSEIDWSKGFRPPDKNRFLSALRRQETSETSYYEAGVEPGMVGRVLGKDVGPNDLNHVLPAADAVELARRMGMDMVTLHEGWVFGRRVTHDASGRRIFLEGLVRTRDDIGRLRHPAPSAVAQRFDDVAAAAEGTGLGIVHLLDTTQGLVVRAMGYDRYFMSIYDDPDMLREFNRRVDEWVLSSTRFIVEQCPVDAVTLPVNLCDKNGPMFNPAHIDEFCFEPLRRQLALIHAAGIPCILHTDGDNSRLVDSYIDMGIAGLHPIEPCPGFDIYDLKRRHGSRICLLGNISLADVLGFGTPEEVDADTREHIRRLAPGGGYICGSSHDINRDVPPENLHAMIHAASTT